MGAGWALLSIWIQEYGLSRPRLVKSCQHFSTAVGWKERGHHSLHRLRTVWPEFWAWLKDPARITRYEQSLMYPENGHCTSLLSSLTIPCQECQQGYCTACWVRGRGRGSDSLVNTQPSDLECRPVTTEYDNQSLQSIHSSIAMSSLELFRVSGPDHLNASNAYSPSPLLHASTSPVGLHYGSPGNGFHLEPPRSGATMRPTFPRNTTDDSAGLSLHLTGGLALE